MRKIGGKSPQGYEIKRSPLHFEGVFACQPVDEGNLVFDEQPDLCMHSNLSDVVACANCFHFIGTVSTQVGIVTQRKGRADLQLQFYAANSHGGNGDGGTRATGNIQEFPGDPILAEQTCLCRDRCGELYCSPFCEAANWDRGHDLMCTGKCEIGEPLVEFKQFAIETNEIFLLVGKLFAKLCKEVETAVAMVPPELAEETKKHVCSQYDSFSRNLWWDVAVDPADSPEKQNQLKESLHMMTAEAWLHLSGALDLEKRGLADLLNQDYIARTIGMFEQNNVGVCGPSPVAKFALSLSNGDQGNLYMGSACQAIHQQFVGDSDDDDGSEYISEEQEDDELEVAVDKEAAFVDSEKASDVASIDVKEEVDEYGDLQVPEEAFDVMHNVINDLGMENIFPPFDGTSFYKEICKMNHSCVPNVRVNYAYEAPEIGLVAQVTALRPIKDGEELFISYIDENLPLEKRRNALRDYGFACTCEKCEAEAQAYNRSQEDIDSNIQLIKNYYNLQPHPEGGFFAETYRSDVEVVTGSEGIKRSASTGIMFLITEKSVSRLHKIKSDEMWHFYSGGPMCVVELNEKTKTCKKTVLGPNFLEGEKVQYVVKRDVWFGSFPLDSEEGLSLVGCTVAPGFEFADFELANRSALLEEYAENKEACEMIEKLCVGL